MTGSAATASETRIPGNTPIERLHTVKQKLNALVLAAAVSATLSPVASFAQSTTIGETPDYTAFTGYVVGSLVGAIAVLAAVNGAMFAPRAVMATARWVKRSIG
jgi:hypothetical protein